MVIRLRDSTTVILLCNFGQFFWVRIDRSLCWAGAATARRLPSCSSDEWLCLLGITRDNTPSPHTGAHLLCSISAFVSPDKNTKGCTIREKKCFLIIQIYSVHERKYLKPLFPIQTLSESQVMFIFLSSCWKLLQKMTGKLYITICLQLNCWLKIRTLNMKETPFCMYPLF